MKNLLLKPALAVSLALFSLAATSQPVAIGVIPPDTVMVCGENIFTLILPGSAGGYTLHIHDTLLKQITGSCQSGLQTTYDTLFHSGAGAFGLTPY